jgi:hypothetical protein
MASRVDRTPSRAPSTTPWARRLPRVTFCFVCTLLTTALAATIAARMLGAGAA